MSLQLRLLFAAFISITLTCCKKEESSSTRQLLLGKWQITKIITDHTVNNQVSSTETQSQFTANDYLLFNDNGTGYMAIKNTYDNKPYGNITFTANTLNENDVNGHWSNGSFSFFINNITKTFLQISYGYTTPGSNPQENYVDKIKLTATRL
ncbi:hypothetical protein [Mucilaginibacter sp. PAMB04168]|uniref:hypothetical protein n=1 Tax=Mucilaginibacter sp. PAMB04168 TaxID=3138567 RepID=UPI0031F60A43